MTRHRASVPIVPHDATASPYVPEWCRCGHQRIVHDIDDDFQRVGPCDACACLAYLPPEEKG